MVLRIDVDDSLRSRIYAWAYRLLRNHDDALDATQDVLVKWLGRGSDAVEHPYGWLRRMTINHCIDLLRRRRPAAEGHDDRAATENPAGRLEQRDVRRRIVHSLGALSEQQRAVVTAKIYDDETFAVIAASMGISVSTVKTHYLRALRTLRDELLDLKEDAR